MTNPILSLNLRLLRDILLLSLLLFTWNNRPKSRLVQHTKQLETLERQVGLLTTAISDNNIRGHSADVATNNNDDTRLDKLEEIVRQ